MTAAVETIHIDRPGIPFTRLVKVELRKMFDTRAGRWLMISIAVLSSSLQHPSSRSRPTAPSPTGCSAPRSAFR